MESDGCDGLAFTLDGDVFFGFESLVQTIAESSTEHHTSRVFINNDDFAVADYIVNILGEQYVCFYASILVVEEFGI